METPTLETMFNYDKINDENDDMIMMKNIVSKNEIIRLKSKSLLYLN